MIRINLLPEEMRGRGRRGAPVRREGLSPMAIAAIALLALLNIVAFYLVFNRAASAKARTKDLQAEIDRKTKERDTRMPEYQQLVDLREQLKVKESILKTLDPPDRILWSQKLNMLCYIVHPQVFITNMKLEEDEKQVETEASIRRRNDWDESKTKTGPEPQPVMVPIITQTMTVTGITTGESNREQLDAFRKFWESLQSYQTKDNRGQTVRFMDGFAKTEVIDPGLVFDQEVAGKQVGQFTITLTTVPMSGETGSEDAGKEKASD